MDTTEIQMRLDRLSKAMLGKGLREPQATMNIKSDENSYVYLKWKDLTKIAHNPYASDEYKHFNNMTVLDALSSADAFVAELPSLEEARLTQFMGALASVIDLGKDNGIDLEYMNTLKATMKKLSENILTDQREKV